MSDSTINKLPIKILLCGLGGWGLTWLKNIRENKNYKLIGVVEKDIDRLNKMKIEYNIAENICFVDIEEAIDALKPDAVAVIVSPDRHGEIIKVAVKKGIHILSEKPLAKDIKEVKDFLNLHKKYPGVRFIVNQNYRGRSSIATIKKIIESGEIGELGFFVYIHSQTCKIPGYRLEIASPLVDDMLIHHVDLIRYFTNQDFIEIYAKEEAVSWSWFKGKPILYANIKMNNMISGIYCASWVSEGKLASWNGNIQIYGSDGCIELTDDEKVIIYKKHKLDKLLLGTFAPGKEVDKIRLENTELQYTLENFKNALINNKKCETDIEDNIKSFVAVLAAKESIKFRKPVTITSLGIV